MDSPASAISLPGSCIGSPSYNMASSHSVYLQNLASTVLYNLQHQHDWTSLCVHNYSSATGVLLPRPLLSGIPPRRLYVHPDEQVEILKAEYETGTHILQPAEREWVLPTHLCEKWTLKAFAQVFDAIDILPQENKPDLKDNNDHSMAQGKWPGIERQKRLLLATLHGDSTVVYYIMHDGIVKPRQN